MKRIYAVIGFMVLFSLIFVFLFLGVCRPLKAYWDVDVDGKCFSNPQVQSIVIAQGGVLPIPCWNVCSYELDRPSL